MPRAADDFSDVRITVLARDAGLQQAGLLAQAKGSSLVGTPVQEGKELAIQVEDADRSAFHLGNFAAAGRYLARVATTCSAIGPIQFL